MKYTRRLSKAQRLLLELQKLTDENARLRDQVATFKPIVKEVARNDFVAAQQKLSAALPFIGDIMPKLKFRTFTREFKVEVARLLDSAVYGTRKRICKDLNVSQAQAYTWLRMYKASGDIKRENNEPDIAIGVWRTPELDAKLELAKAAFSDVWKGGKRERQKRSAASLAEHVRVTPAVRFPQQGAVGRNPDPFRKA